MSRFFFGCCPPNALKQGLPLEPRTHWYRVVLLAGLLQRFLVRVF